MVLAFKGLGLGALQNLIYFTAMIKIGTSLIWMITVSLNTNMGVAWHRFLGFPNIWFKRNADGAVALGALQPMTSGGKEIDFEDPGEDDVFGVSQVEQFSWKGILDFSTCTECGRCQSQCPAWNTGKPLSPKLLIMSLRDHAHAKAPYLLAGGGKDMEGNEKASEEQLKDVPAAALAEAERPSSARSRRTASSTRTCSGPAPPAVRAWSSARSTSSTSTTSSTCAATR